MYQSRRSNKYPKIWLMTDKRNDSVLEQAIAKLPKGSGIIFRHYHLDIKHRQKRFAEVRKAARKYQHILILADRPALARKWGADGVHGRNWKRRDTKNLLHSAPVHNAREIAEAERNGADIIFLSPAFATRSHLGGQPLHLLQLRRLKQLLNQPGILLGGMNKQRFKQYQSLHAHGWAAIDALS